MSKPVAPAPYVSVALCSVVIAGLTLGLGPAASTRRGRSAGDAGRAARANPCAEQQKLTVAGAPDEDGFGTSVAIAGDMAVVGRPGRGGLSPATGSVLAYVRVGAMWTEDQVLTASDAAPADLFGKCISIDGGTLIVGAPDADPNGLADAGAAYVFVRVGGTWIEQRELTASDASPGDHFGCAVAISGDAAMVGAPSDDNAGGQSAGSAYAYARAGGAWTEQQRLGASDAASADELGGSVVLSGDTAIIGADNDLNAGGLFAGAAYVFLNSGGAWVEQQKLTAQDGAVGDHFGDALALSGETVIVGAHLDDNGGGANAGAAYVFARSGAAWIEQQKLTASDAVFGDAFGFSVALSGDMAIVGSPGKAVGGAPDAGSASVFVRTGGTFVMLDQLLADGAGTDDGFGSSVALDAGSVIGGTWLSDPGRDSPGFACIFSCALANAPACSAGGPYSSQCDGVALSDASASDPDGDPLTFLWESDCDGDGVFGEPGDGSFDDASLLNPTFLAPDPCGSSCTIRLTVDDGSGTCTSVARVSVDDTTPPVLSLLPQDATVECPAPPPPVVTALDNCSGNVSVTFTEEVLPPVDRIGCADGEREGYVDLAQFPDIAGCSGGWSIPGILSGTLDPACGHQAGDDSANPLGFDCDVADMCSPGWHVAASAGEVTAHDPTGGAGAVPPGQSLFFATRQSGTGCGICATGVDLANPPCNGGSCVVGCAQTDFTSNDVFGVGNIGAIPNAATCFGLNRFSNDACFSLGPPWSCAGNGENEALIVTKSSPLAGGVVCVPDAPGGLDCPEDHVIRRTWRAVDACGNAVVHVQILTVVDTTPPVITPGALAPCYTSVQDAVDAALAATQVADACGGAVEVTTATQLVGCALSIGLTASDECDHVSTFTYGTTVDATPPVVTPSAEDVFCLWPPNHWWACFGRDDFHFEVTDDCLGPVTWSFADCASSQPENDIGDGNTGPDCMVSPDGEQVCVRAERQGGDPAGRTYSVGVVAMDACGNASQQVIGRVFVPHDARQHLGCLKTTRVGQKPRRAPAGRSFRAP
jgi:hypothetical protein